MDKRAKAVLFVLTLAAVIWLPAAPLYAAKTGSAKTNAAETNAAKTGPAKTNAAKTDFSKSDAAQAGSDKGNTDENDTTAVTISAAGDCTFGSDRISPSSTNFYAVYKKQKDPAYFFKNVKKYFKQDDLTLINFEGVLTKRTTRADKKYAFKGSPGYVDILKKGSVEAAAFANNHCRDFGEGSYTDTEQCFQKAGITYSSYEKVGIYEVKGKKIGMISVNGLEGTEAAKTLVKKGMKKLKKKEADLRIVSIHAGIEYEKLPSDAQKSLARYAVDQGADLVLGHHPHILQGIEKYRGSYIVYSLGNFCFGGNTNPVDKDTMIFQQTFLFRDGELKKKESKVKIIPCSLSSASGVNNYQPTPVSGKKKKQVLKKIDLLCRPLGLTLQNDKGKFTHTLYKVET